MEKSTRVTKTQLGFYFDQSRCMSCNACTVACKDWNQLNPGLVNWRDQFTYEKDGKFFPFSIGCNHCEEPACLTACSQNAISKADDGIVTIDREKCIELQACLDACPFAKPQIADDKQEPNTIIGWQTLHPAQKCTMCTDRLDEGLKPACVSSCIGRALDFGEMAVLEKTYGGANGAVRLNATDFPYVYKNNKTDTKPAMLVKKKSGTSLTIHKSTSYKPK